ncbi:hypothetical protein RI129_001998 [Pyrocoelia pectoralis]|uniref:Dicer-2 n=1 Tax=Pyrocoelia pectoralis TaxID=417401 RepID=A0AAN7VWW0_9COLE
MDYEMELTQMGKDDFVPRDYQITIMEVGVTRNIIIFLPTGTGKTLIAVMILKRLSEPLQRRLSEGGKISIMLVNTQALVDQQSKYLRALTDQDVAAFSGDMNVDYWSSSKWKDHFEKNQILVMTTQILVNLLQRSILSLNDVNLLIFDECHNGVDDHPMTQVMAYYPNLKDPPRVIGLSATLLNRNCKPDEVLDEVQVLENTFHSKVVTVGDLACLTGYATNPQEEIREYVCYECSEVDRLALGRLDDLISVIQVIHTNKRTTSPPKPNLEPLNNDGEFKHIIALINDVKYHIQNFGSYCAEIALAAHNVQLELIKRHCENDKVRTVIDAVISAFKTIEGMYQIIMRSTDQPERIYRYSSPQVNKLIHVLEEYKNNAKVPLCGIIFVQRRFTAKIIYNVLKDLKDTDPFFSFIDPNFIVGFNVSTYNTREGLYNSKMNKKILNDFKMKKINLLVASNVLEEGVDIPTCTLVVNFCGVKNYRAYIQSKGRARHANSFYYMLVNDGNDDFYREYQKIKKIEDLLNLHLTDKKLDIEEPIDDPLGKLDGDLLPYYVDGPNSPQVNSLTAIPLLCLYCSYLPADKYTTYTPNWFIEHCRGSTKVRVIIELPPVSGILEPIAGPFMPSKKLAKRAAALEMCKILHERGELDDKLLPRRRTVLENEFDHYFTHWAKEKESDIGNTRKQIKMYDRKIPEICKGLIRPNEVIYLHIIELQPLFHNHKNLQNLYQSDLCYGFLSTKPLPKLCQFSVYVTAGEILVNLNTNYKQITLTRENILPLRNFHYLIFNDVLRILKPFLVLDDDYNKNGFLVVPIKKQQSCFEIDFETAINNKELLDQHAEPTSQPKLSLKVTKENYHGTVITTWYRKDDRQYIVIKVCDDLNVMSAFPAEGFTNYADYFTKKYNINIINLNQPLLLAKGISKRLNCVKPRGRSGKNNEVDEGFKHHLVAELCVKQEFPGTLWLQGTLLPTILNRIESLLQADELRILIAKGIQLGVHELAPTEKWASLVLDKHVVNKGIEGVEYFRAKEHSKEAKTFQDTEIKNAIATSVTELAQDFAVKNLNAEYPWQEVEEPIDIERRRNVTLTDVQYFHNFVSRIVLEDHHLQKNEIANRSRSQTLSVTKDYIYKPLQVLNCYENNKGPELIDIFTALTTAKNNDIVNLERLETLGDSFLKLSISLFLLLKYPTFDEGMLTSFKGKLISNNNLFYIGDKKGISGYVKVSEFAPDSEWKPPAFNIPKILRDRIDRSISINSLFQFNFTKEEQILGLFTERSRNKILLTCDDIDETEENVENSTYSFLDKQAIRDKSVADSVEALLGVYFQAYGFQGGLRFLKWLGIVPEFENIDRLFEMEPPNPAFVDNIANRSIEYHIPAWEKVEARLCYKFRNRAYLLQALTHASYVSNRITNCYQTLEFLGDAVLDFLITCYIFEASESLSPGDLTDLRSALVNNVTFACFTVRCGFQKHLLFSNNQLSKYIDTFVRYQELNNHKINDEVLTLISEEDLHLGEHIDVPKVLGDTFEALIGAVFLDCGMCLEIVWEIVHRIMWKEMELFLTNVPKNPIRMIHEMVGARPEFGSTVNIDDGRVLIKLEFIMNGVKKIVYGAGDSKASAKKAASKIALRLLCK